MDARFAEIDAGLDACAGLWRESPFRVARPAWCERLPGLAAEALALDDAALRRLEDDGDALDAWVGARLPEAAGLSAAARLPRLAGALREPDSRLGWTVPGRKQAQIEAFAAAAGPIRRPATEWCSGKGHLGRWLAFRWRIPVVSVERDAALCEQGRVLARRAGVVQTFRAADVHSAAPGIELSGRHAVALHACGDLHLALLRRVVRERAAALDLAPCCYHLGGEDGGAPMGGDARLRTTRDDRRLAVTGTATAGAGERLARERATAWKLGFVAWRAEATGEDGYRSFRPVPAAWLRGGFEDFCRLLAEREGIATRGAPPVAGYEAAGWRRQAEAARLSLVRHAFGRPLEAWLVLDRARYLAAAGWEVRLGEFCPREVTPRNLLISARLG